MTLQLVLSTHLTGVFTGHLVYRGGRTGSRATPSLLSQQHFLHRDVVHFVKVRYLADSNRALDNALCQGYAGDS